MGLLDKYDFDELMVLARRESGRQSVFDWLKRIEVVPRAMLTARPVYPKVGLRSTDLTGAYLASCAFEWDSWGLSTPVEFLEGLRPELSFNGEVCAQTTWAIFLSQRSQAMDREEAAAAA